TDIGGSLLVDGRITYRDGRLEPYLRLDLDGVFMRSREWDLIAEKISGSLTINSFAPFLTEGPQRINIGRAVIGEIKLANTTLDIEPLPSGAFILREVASDWAGGRLSCEDVLIDPAKGSTEVKVKFEKINLAEILENYAPDRAVGEGYLSGYWTLMPRWSPKPGLYAGEGKLEAIPKAGWFRIIREADLDVVLGVPEELPEGQDMTTHEQLGRVKTALRDFEYNDLEITFLRDRSNDIAMQVNTQGQGRSTDPPIAVGGARFNIPKLDLLLNTFIIRTTESKALLETKIDKELRKISGPDEVKEQEKTAKEKAEEQAIDAFF
ncbi:MAG: YdbH domain-containing protein, partial [Planctomycetes bacterium]|nr:YdbH domain-containing protein [Planctomycetota bacterium]